MAQSNQTEINAAVHGNAADAGAAVSSGVTEINTAVRGDTPNYTVVNPTVQNYTVELPAGTLLAGKYRVEEPLTTHSGEANLYICAYRKGRYVAKVYRRQSAVKEDIVLALETIKSPNIARLYATGTVNGSPFEILPYYQYGSLEGKTFSMSQLRGQIIPALNEGLHTLHKHNIIHKDLKPSNIMMCDDQKNVAIIDFGISSIREGGSTVVVTKTGMTPEYSAPETFRSLYLEESDYYSLGITLYELYTGHTPFSGLSRDAIEQYLSIQKVPFPDDFPAELKSLVLGLTYTDITNRKDKSNPNRRWTYEEVVRWCKGETLEIPGASEEAGQGQGASRMPPFRFQYKKYTTVEELAEALGRDWVNGKKRLYRSLLTAHFKTFDQEITNHCMDAEETVQRDPARADIELFSLLYKMYPGMRSFHWKDYHFDSMQELGCAMLSSLRSSDAYGLGMIDSIIENHLFSSREQVVDRDDGTRTGRVAAMESRYLMARQECDERAQQEQAYLLAYLYSESRELKIPFGTFDSVEALTGRVKALLAQSPDKLDELSRQLIQQVSRVKYKSQRHYTDRPSDVATAQFSAWLYVQGMGDILDY